MVDAKHILFDDCSICEPTVIYQSDDFVVLNKPSGWHTVKSGNKNKTTSTIHNRTTRPNIEEWLCTNFETHAQLPEAGIVHRLDQLTSGCLLVATTSQSHTRYSIDFRTEKDSRIVKKYLAVVSNPAKGQSLSTTGDWGELYFASRYKRSKKVTVTHTGNEKELGRCSWSVLRTDFCANSSGQLVAVKILGSGKRHQIRAGFAHLGYPLLGDTLYRGPDWDQRFGLHSWKLTVNSKMIQCPAPANWVE